MNNRAKVISLSIDTINVELWKNRIEKKLNHHFLYKHIDRPEINEEKLRILIYLFQNNLELTDDQIEMSIIATTLVQTALDTHEKVSIHFDSKKDSREKVLNDQLSVLAGDYYSGLYYYLLSEIREVDLIHLLATAIKEINEYKMNLYYMKDSSLEEHIAVIQEIESLLYVYIAKATHSTELIPIIKKWLLINRLEDESKRIINNEHSIIDRLSNVHFESNNQKAMDSFYTILEKTKAELEVELTKLPADFFSFKNYVDEALKVACSIDNQVVEEG